MSANLIVDLGNVADYRASVVRFSGSNLLVGEIVDLLHANTATQIYVGGNFGSGPIEVRVQTSDSTASGTFTDPTSGLPQFPSVLCSGGIFWANSGLWQSGNYSLSAPVNNAPLFCSGGVQFAFFQRPHRYARLVYISGDFPNPIQAGFVANKRTTGSGGGFTLSPTSGTVNV